MSRSRSARRRFLRKGGLAIAGLAVATPGTTNPHHLSGNLGAARGRLPDAAMRREVERFCDALP